MTIAQSCFRIFICCSLAVSTVQARGAEVAAEKSDGATLLSLDKEQRLLADTFTKLEETFIKRADIEAASNPTRAHLLRQAAQLSKQLATQQRLNIAVDYLAKGQFTRALQEQEAARDNLQKLLELLQQENRSKRLRDERETIEKLIKEVHRIERLQRSLRGRTEAGQEVAEAKQEQESLKNETSKVGEELEKANKSKEEESKPGDGGAQPNDSKSDQDKSGKESKGGDKSQSGDKDSKQKDAEQQRKPKDGEKDNSGQEGKQADKDSDKKTEDGQKQDQNGEHADSSKQDSSKQDSSQQDSSKQDSSKQQSPDSQGQQSQSPSQGEKSESQSQDGQQGDQGKQDQAQKPKEQHQTPEKKAQDRVQRARQRMQQAQEQLQKDERQDAVEQQREAERELAAAVEELESILRQMREEEVERSLASLESRFRKMLTMQTEVLKQTEKYANTEGGLDERQIELQSVKLGIEEKKILIEGQHAMLLLEEEGSSMAFPEAVEQLNSDVALIAELFKQNRMDHSNVQLQQQVVATLEELLESLTAVQKDKEKKKEQKKNQQQNGGGQQGQQSQDLVDKLAELRLIRTLQMRINKRTGWLAQQNGTKDDPLGQVKDPLLSQQTRELGQRQERLEGVLRDIILQGNAKK